MRNKKIGILGGGQLGRMLVQEAIKLDLDISFLDKGEDFPVANAYPKVQQGSFLDYQDVLSFGEDKDILSIEIENVNTEALKALENEGKLVYPQVDVINIIKDKGLQKDFYSKHEIPTSSYRKVDNISHIIKLVDDNELKFPFVQKSRLAGYDGKGVAVIKDKSELSKLIEAPSIIEDCVEIEKELAIVFGRNAQGDICEFPMTEMVFNVQGNLLDYLIAPADISEELNQQASKIGRKVIESLDMIGLLAVEFFLTKKGDILVNESAPRPHNSGHYTMDACNYSQFNIHLRTLLGLDLPSITQHHPALMWNVLGELNYQGIPQYEGLHEVLNIEGVYPHIYGKTLTKSLRKMGHINILGSDRNSLLRKLDIVKKKIKVICQ